MFSITGTLVCCFLGLICLVKLCFIRTPYPANCCVLLVISRVEENHNLSCGSRLKACNGDKMHNSLRQSWNTVNEGRENKLVSSISHYKCNDDMVVPSLPPIDPGSRHSQTTGSFVPPGWFDCRAPLPLPPPQKKKKKLNEKNDNNNRNILCVKQKDDNQEIQYAVLRSSSDWRACTSIGVGMWLSW